MVWRFVGVASTVVGLLCYALSSSFNHLFGEWNSWKICFYTLFSFITFLLVLLVKDWQKLKILRFLARKWQRLRILRFRSLTQFLVMASTTVFSFLSDRADAPKGKPDTYSVISSVAFATMSLSLSRHVPFVFVELMYFFMGVLIAQMMKIKLLLGCFAGIVLSFCLVVLHSYLAAPLERLGIQDQPQVVIDVASLRSSGRNHAIVDSHVANTALHNAPTSDFDDHHGSSDPFDLAGTKNDLTDRLKRWRQAALVLKASRRFRYDLDLKKEEEKKQISSKVRQHAQAIREEEEKKKKKKKRKRRKKKKKKRST